MRPAAETAAPAPPAARPTDGCPPAPSAPRNVGDLLRSAAADVPDRPAVLTPRGRAGDAERTYDALTFAELDREADRLAAALAAAGVTRGDRVGLMVKPGGRFAVAVFGALRAGAAAVLIDPGLGVRSVLRCLAEANPVAFLGEPAAVLAGRALAGPAGLRSVRTWVSAGRAVPGAVGWEAFLSSGEAGFTPPSVGPTDAAAVIFTSGSTGPAKGVAYEHGMFLAQVDLLRAGYGFGTDGADGEVDVPAFPLFALFDVGLRATMVVPRMQTHRPAFVRPAEILDPIAEYGAARAFGSPALWARVLPEALRRHRTKAFGGPPDRPLAGVRHLLSAGAPVPPSLHETVRSLPGADLQLHTPYGATEALPVCTTGTDEVLGTGDDPGTAAATRRGAGTCVGKPFPGVTVRVIAATNGVIPRIEDVTELPPGEIGEVIVASPSVTREYVGRPEQTRRAKIADPAAPTGVWHRMGDVGYLDERGRLWFCGRQGHVVGTPVGPQYPVMIEGVLNEDPAVVRSAVVGVETPCGVRAVAVVEPSRRLGPVARREARRRLMMPEFGSPPRPLADVLFRRTLPTDVRHNTKIDRPALARWAAKGRRAPVRRWLAGW